MAVPLEPVATNDTGGQHVKGLEVFTSPLVAKLQSAVVADPGQRLLDHVAGLSQATAVRTASGGDQTSDHDADQHLDDPNEAVSSISLQRFGLLATFAFAVGQHRQ